MIFCRKSLEIERVLVVPILVNRSRLSCFCRVFLTRDKSVKTVIDHPIFGCFKVTESLHLFSFTSQVFIEMRIKIASIEAVPVLGTRSIPVSDLERFGV